jgi:hypothetical protein
MSSSTLKRSAATLGVVTGLLAAAVPAGAHVGASSTRDVASSEVFELNTFGGNDTLTDGADDRVVVLIGANDYGFAHPKGS